MAKYNGEYVPNWWLNYLPDEKNPYKHTDTLTIKKGELKDFWHIHSSNKYPNPDGIEDCEFVQRMLYRRFGGAFLSNYDGSTWGRWVNEEKKYREPNHLTYENAYLDEHSIHIKDAHKYYEDVRQFMLDVLHEVTIYRMQSTVYGISSFFPYRTDAQIEEDRKKYELKKQRTEEYRQKLSEIINGDDFFINEVKFADIEFSTAFFGDDDFWFNTYFTTVGFEADQKFRYASLKVCFIIECGCLCDWNHKKKDKSKATKTLKIYYCLFAQSNRKLNSFENAPDTVDTEVLDIFPTTIIVPKSRIGANIESVLLDGCTKAMDKYNAEHTEAKTREVMYSGHGQYTRRNEIYYDSNIFLDNNIGKLKLEYKENITNENMRRRGGLFGVI